MSNTFKELTYKLTVLVFLKFQFESFEIFQLTNKKCHSLCEAT